MMMSIKKAFQRILPKPFLFLYRFLRIPNDKSSVSSFLLRQNKTTSFYERCRAVWKMYEISDQVPCPHTQHEMVSVIRTIFSIPAHLNGCVCEAGSFKGGSTAKFSIACKIAGRRLFVFDSFEGIPESSDNHDENISGEKAYFKKGSYYGSLEEVRNNVQKYGEIGVCKFIKGWFEDTLPQFSEPIAVLYIDVDLASSTHTCLKYLYPLVVPGGVIYSQDGHLQRIIDLLRNNGFWEKEVRTSKPHIEGLGETKLIKIVKK
jgi:O-methyltransferase